MDSCRQPVLFALACLLAVWGCADAGPDASPDVGADTSVSPDGGDAGDGDATDVSPDGPADSGGDDADTGEGHDSGERDGSDAPCLTCLRNPVWDVRLSDTALAQLNADPMADVRVHGMLAIDGREYEVGVELHGGSSRRYPKRSLALHFDDDDPLVPDPFGLGDGLLFDKLILKATYKDQSFVREPIAWELLRRIGLPAPRTGWINLTLNGAYHGLFVVTEPIDRDYLRRRGFDDDGNLYKAVDQAATMRPSMVVDQAFERRTNDEGTWDDLEAFMDLLQQTPATEDEFYEHIDPVWPLEEWLERLIWVSYTQNLDTWRQNYFLYNEGTADDPDWTLLAWDSDVCMSQHWSIGRDVYDVEWSHMLDGNAYFGKRIMSIDSIRHAHVARFTELLDTTYSADAVLPLLEDAIDRVADDAAVDLAFWGRSSTPETEFDEIRHFVTERPRYLREQLAAFRDDPDIPDYRE